MAELAPTKVPGEPLFVSAEGGWRNYLPLLDHVLSAIDQGRTVRIFTSEGRTLIVPPSGLFARFRAYWKISRDFARLSGLRNKGEGYAEALAAHGIRFDPALTGPGGFDEEIAWETVTGWIRQGVIPDAIFASDDESALGAMIAIKEAGLEVPRDIAVAGFDDIRLARYLTPPLTTVRAPIEMAGRAGIEQLVRLIRTGEADPLTLLPTELIIRRSCGYP